MKRTHLKKLCLKKILELYFQIFYSTKHDICEISKHLHGYVLGASTSGSLKGVTKSAPKFT